MVGEVHMRVASWATWRPFCPVDGCGQLGECPHRGAHDTVWPVRAGSTDYPWILADDPFDERHSFEEIAALWGLMAAARSLHEATFQVLTRHPMRALEWLAWLETWPDKTEACVNFCDEQDGELRDALPVPVWNPGWPVPGVSVGVLVSTQREAEDRLELLQMFPAERRIVMLAGDVDLSPWLATWECCNACREYYPTAEALPDPDGHRHGRDECAQCGATDHMLTMWGEGQLERWQSGDRYAPEHEEDLRRTPVEEVIIDPLLMAPHRQAWLEAESLANQAGVGVQVRTIRDRREMSGQDVRVVRMMEVVGDFDDLALEQGSPAWSEPVTQEHLQAWGDHLLRVLNFCEGLRLLPFTSVRGYTCACLARNTTAEDAPDVPASLLEEAEQYLAEHRDVSAYVGSNSLPDGGAVVWVIAPPLRGLWSRTAGVRLADSLFARSVQQAQGGRGT